MRKYRRAPRAAWRTIAGETILLDLEAKRMYGLNPTAAFVWQALEAITETDGMLQALGADGADPPFGGGELEAFLGEMLDLGLIQEAEPENRAPVAVEPPETLEAPAIAWRETVEQVAASCAFFPGTTPICNQVPWS